MTPLANGLIGGAFAIGFALTLAAVAWLLPFVYEYRTSVEMVEVRAFGIVPVFSLRAGDLVDVNIEEAGSLLAMMRHNPFRTLRLGNRITRRYVVVTKRGLIKYVIVTPKNVDEFCQLIRDMIGRHRSPDLT
jgi:hypothetical protein